MGRYADVSDLLARASADDLARAASRDTAAVDGALLRRAVAEGLPLDGAALTRLREESASTLYAAASVSAAFVAADFTERSSTGAVTPPAFRVSSYIAFALPTTAAAPSSIDVDGSDMTGGFVAGGSALTIAGAEYRWWRSKLMFSSRTYRSRRPRIRIAPVDGPRWNGDAVAALPDVFAKLDAALEGADAEIESYVRGRFGLPEPSPALTMRAADIAIQTIISGGEGSPEHERCQHAYSWLRDVATGRVELDRPAPSPAPRPRIVDVGGSLAGLGAY